MSVLQQGEVQQAVDTTLEAAGATDVAPAKGYNEKLLEMLRKDNTPIRLQTSTLEKRDQLRVILHSGVEEKRLVTLSIASTEAEKKRAADLVTDAYVSTMGVAMEPRNRFRFFNMMEEAIANAVRDGNGHSEHLKVTITYGVFSRGGHCVFGVFIEDQGQGFILEEVISPTARAMREGRDGEGGMGLLKINARLQSDQLLGRGTFFPYSTSQHCRELFLEVMIGKRS